MAWQNVFNNKILDVVLPFSLQIREYPKAYFEQDANTSNFLIEINHVSIRVNFAFISELCKKYAATFIMDNAQPVDEPYTMHTLRGDFPHFFIGNSSSANVAKRTGIVVSTLFTYNRSTHYVVATIGGIEVSIPRKFATDSSSSFSKVFGDNVVFEHFMGQDVDKILVENSFVRENLRILKKAKS